MNKIDEYKKKINYDAWADVTSLSRNLFQDSIKDYHNSHSENRIPRDRERTMINQKENPR